MKKIVESRLITNTDAESFCRDMAKDIDDFQQKGYEVEVKYQTTMRGYEVVYSVLLLGYRDG